MSRRVVTKEDIASARGGVLEVGPDDLVTAAALEAATRAAVQIVRKGESAPAAPARPETKAPVPAAPRESAPWDSFGSGTAAQDGRTTAIVTAVGRNRPFVLAEISTKIGELNGDIADISQRIVGGYFSTIFIVDIGRISTDFAGFKGAVEGLSKTDDYKIVVQHERVFRAMHRI